MLDKVPIYDRDLTYLNRVLVNTLHLACLLTREMPEAGTEEYSSLHKAMYELVRINARGKEVPLYSTANRKTVLFKNICLYTVNSLLPNGIRTEFSWDYRVDC